MSLKIYNTMSREKEPFQTIEPGKVRMYVCGPTVYAKAHVGHAMSSLVFDVIRRYLEYRGYEVRHVMNYTDVDDKVILRAKELGVDPLELAKKFADQYDQHLKDLNIEPAQVKPKVSEEIEQIITMVSGLIDKGFAYEVDGDVYFRVARDKDYGRLSGRSLEDMRAGARLEVDQRKEDPGDFALWKAAKEGEPSWASPWGQGRPGWHIECSAMCLHHLGEQIDIHGGGNDLIFPHHENEIAQSESYTGKVFARFWVHNGMMQLGGEDMSKSTGNVYAIDDFLKMHDGDVLRMVVLNGSYRSPLTFNDEVVDQAERALERLRNGLRPALANDSAAKETGKELAQAGQKAREKFEAAMDDDFNTSGALSHIFELVKTVNQARDAGASESDLTLGQSVIRELAGVLGLRLDESVSKDHEAAPFIQMLVDVREELREIEQWQLADSIRDRLASLGVSVEDQKDGTVWRFQ
ncbi:MAG: cysteine--tRNA ligase [Anaerolineales bacterium]|jgi:cysteinyl-tRNA synthetase